MDANHTQPQPSESPQRAELVSNPSRLALPLFKGIDYQIWQTVLAWMDLGEGDVLVVEGAEDFDTISQSLATAHQIKNLASPISLRSDCVCDALRNFWIARNRNPGRVVRFCLITTAATTTEAGAPFGVAKPGLELWNQEASGVAVMHSKQLKEFLLLDASASKRLAEPFDSGTPSLIEHLHTLSAEAFRTEFVCRIQWLTRQPDVDIVRELVRVRLHAYGEGMHLLPRDSERVLAPLFEHVAHIAFRQKRKLSREDLRVLFDDSTRVNIPLSQHNQMQAALALLQPSSPPATQVRFAVLQTLSIPDLPAPCATRDDCVNALVQCVVAHRFIAVQGSTGKGKSTLAKLVARKLGGDWFWVGFAGKKFQQISDELHRLAHYVAGQSVVPSLLIDDFNPKGAELLPLLQRLAVLCRLALAHGGRMIVTTQRVLGEPFLRLSNLTPEVLHQVGAFRVDEVRDLCVQSGCPLDNRLISWVAIVSFQTGRHPQLAHARIKVAERRGWPMPNIDDVLGTPQEIADERQLARQLLQELEDSEVEFLYRLSLASQPFRKDQAVAVAEILPAITRPGEKFDALLGPWIESSGREYFRLSHLLVRLAEENWTPERVRTTRIKYARAIHRTRDCTLLEASEILFQAVLTKEASLAGRVLASLVLAPFKSRKIIAEWFDWVLVLEEASVIFPENPLVSHFFSLVQFRVAVASQSDSTPKFAERLFNTTDKSIAPAIDSCVAIGAATDIIIETQVLVSPSLLLQAWLSIKRYTNEDKRLEKIARSIEDKRRNSGRSLPRQAFEEMLFGFILNRRGGGIYFRLFISAVDSLSREHREHIVAAMRVNYFGLVGLVDDIWTHELGNGKPDWGTAIAILEEAQTAGERWCLPELVGIAARGIAAIQDEYLQSPDEALKALDTAIARVGDSLMVRYQRGMVHFLAKRHSQAYEAWLSTLNEWPTGDEIAALYAFNASSNCGAAAGFLGEWDNASSAFEKGQELALKVRRELDALKFGMDAAYSQWKAGNKKQALSKFAICLTEMEQLSQTDESPEFHTTWKVMEHMAVWFKSDSGAPHKLEIINPRPGICSEAKSKERHDLVKDARRAPVSVSWYCLAEAELYAGLGREMFSKISARNDLSSYPNLRPLFEFLRARRALADREFRLIPIFTELSSFAFVQIDANSITEESISKKSQDTLLKTAATSKVKDIVEESLLCALLVACAEDIPWGTLLEQWRAGAPRMQSPAILTTAVETIEQICMLTPMRIYHAMSTSPRFNQVVGGLRLALHPDSRPAMHYIALCSLVTDVGFATNMMFSHEALAKLTRNTWLERLSIPFELISPRITVPAIKAACESNKKGLALAATILLAAGDAVSVRKTASNLLALRKLAGEVL